jgi:hypothetical protein
MLQLIVVCTGGLRFETLKRCLLMMGTSGAFDETTLKRISAHRWVLDTISLFPHLVVRGKDEMLDVDLFTGRIRSACNQRHRNDDDVREPYRLLLRATLNGLGMGCAARACARCGAYVGSYCHRIARSELPRCGSAFKHGSGHRLHDCFSGLFIAGSLLHATGCLYSLAVLCTAICTLSALFGYATGRPRQVSVHHANLNLHARCYVGRSFTGTGITSQLRRTRDHPKSARPMAPCVPIPAPCRPRLWKSTASLPCAQYLV